MSGFDWIAIGCTAICLLCVLGVYIALGIFSRICKEMAALCDQEAKRLS